MSRLFDDSFVRPLGGTWITDGDWGVPLDVQAKDDEYLIRANVPGLKPEDLKIEVIDNTVNICGEVKSEHKTEQENYLLQERHYGSFSRSLTLPTRLNPARCEAEIENGVLTVRIPKAEEARPKAIAIKTKGK
ncbi:MAG: Hsp20/alpha crystallin family protein [Anaerolineales bacterium]